MDLPDTSADLAGGDQVQHPQAQQPRFFQCSTCQQSFTRVDHLMRHVRSHTKSKPYVCQTCGKGFGRVDLLKKHATNHSPDHQRKLGRPPPKRESRAVRACEDCAKQHLRCDDSKPCGRCRKKDIPCIRPVLSGQNSSAQQDTTGVLEDETEETNAAQDLLHFSGHFTRSTEISDLSQHGGEHDLQQEHHVQDLAVLPQPTSVPSLSFSESSPGDLYLPANTGDFPATDNVRSGVATPRGAIPFNYDWDIDFSTMDFSAFTNDYTMAEVMPQIIDHQSFPEQSLASKTRRQDDVTARVEAFEQSVLRYVPHRRVNPVRLEEANLAVGQHQDQAQVLSQESYEGIEVKVDRLSYVARDKLLALVLSVSSSDNLAKITRAFPSIEFLDAMVRRSVTAHSVDSSSWFHIPTFSVNYLLPELLICVIAAGAASMPDVQLQKFGLALEEMSRIGIGRAFDHDNALIRDIDLLQAQLLQLQVGMWSGLSRKTELAESFLQPPTTMLRRGGRFGRFIWRPICPPTEEDPAMLEARWREWVRQESWLRLVWKYFELDKHSSMALMKPPLISYAEMKLPLPQPDILWYAPSAAVWKSTYSSLSVVDTMQTTLYDCLDDGDLLSRFSMADSGYVCMLWGMVWDYRQMAQLSSSLHLGNDLLRASLHQEIAKRGAHFRESRSSTDIYTIGTLEATLMHLNAPLDELQTFAGIAGPEEAAEVHAALSEWSTQSSARQAVCHAANLMKISSSFETGTLQKLHAIVLYHAALVLCVYGLLSRPAVNHGGLQGSNASVDLMNDQQLAIKKFVTTGRAEPSVWDANQRSSIFLKDASAVMESAISLLRNNHDTPTGTRPPLVESLIKLMESLKPTFK